MKNLTLRETIDLRTWLARCGKAGLAAIPAKVCPIEISVAELIAGGGRPALQAVSDWTVRAAGRIGKGMWRWSLCAPIEVKAAMSHPGLLVRMPWPIDATDDKRFRAILNDADAAGITATTAIVRPWVVAAAEGGYPVEFRVFVTKAGATSTTSYYTQRPLGTRWLPFAREAARLASLLRPHVEAGVEFSADFLVTPDGRILFIEGGPTPQFDADPCCLAADHPMGDGAIVLSR